MTYPVPRLQVPFEKCYFFLRRVIFTPCPSPKLKDHFLSPVCPLYAQLRMRYSMVMGTHLSRKNADSNQFFKITVYVVGRVLRLATGWAVRGSNPVGGEIFRTCPDRPWGPPSLLYNGYRAFTGGKERPGRDADPSHLLVPWSWKDRAIPLLPLWTVRTVQSLSAYTRMHFTFIFTVYVTDFSENVS
jgi:hypothetical protein